MVWNMLGDMEFFANVLGMSHLNSDELCWACDASKKDAARDWQCNWANRGWTLRDPADYKFNTLHPLFKLHGVCALTSCTAWTIIGLQATWWEAQYTK